MPRIEGVNDAEAGLIQRGVFRESRRRVGAVIEPLRLMAHSSAVMWAAGLFETVFKRARSVDPRLKDLAALKAASMTGCVF
ncbi:MAG: hypothetical protein VX546_13750 [Myxococcota bacterium]|nr:hypothetical protein [Myxococcota bacterium]